MSGEQEPTMIRRNTGKTIQQYLADIEAQKMEQQQKPTTQPQFNPAYAQSANYIPQQGFSEQQSHRNVPNFLRNMSGRAIALTATGALIAAGFYGYSQDFMGSQGIIRGMSGQNVANASLSTVYNTNPIETLGSQALLEPNCESSNATLVVADITGEMPLIPLAPTALSKTPVKAPPYMLKNSIASVAPKDQAVFSRLVKDSVGGYQKATLQHMEVAGVACEITDAASAAAGITAVSNTGNQVTIHRELIHFQFKDMNELYKNANYIIPTPQTDSIAHMSLDPKNGATMTYPAGIYANVSGDTAFNAAIAATAKSMQTPDQLQAITSTMESAAITQLNDVYAANPNIAYKDSGVKQLRDAIDKALIQRLVGNTSKTINISGNYVTNMYTPKNPTTKQSIILPDPKTHAPAIKGFAPSDFKIDNISVQVGSIQPPKPQSTSPSPTPTN